MYFVFRGVSTSVCDFTNMFQCIFEVCAVDTRVDSDVLAITCSRTKAAEAKVGTEETITIS